MSGAKASKPSRAARCHVGKESITSVKTIALKLPRQLDVGGASWGLGSGGAIHLGSPRSTGVVMIVSLKFVSLLSLQNCSVY